MTISNLAVLQQRLGADQRALDLYAQLRTGETMQPSEEAQLLINQGWLFRRLGDPTKAMETYRQAQALFARSSTAMARSAPGATSGSRTPWTSTTTRGPWRRSRRR